MTGIRAKRGSVWARCKAVQGRYLKDTCCRPSGTVDTREQNQRQDAVHTENFIQRFQPNVAMLRLCLSKISKCLSAWELVFLHNSRRCSFFSRHSSHLWPRSSGRVLPSGSRTWLYAIKIGVLHRSAGKRPKLTTGDRLLWICLSRLWRDWRSALAILKPETVVAWHRAFRLFWTWKVRCGKPGRPVISSEVRDLIRKMCRENPGWRCTTDPRRTAQTGHRRRRE